MRAFRWSTPAAVGLAVSLLFLPGLLLPARAAIIASSEPVTAVIATSHFEEPLVAVGPSSPAEDEALKQALNSYQQRSQPGDRSSIETFLSQNPHSMWAPALWTNLGLSYLHDGFFSRAIDAWQKAWLTGKLATDPRAKALVDRAIGELAQLYANLGRNEQLAALFEEVGQRPITGSATEAFQNAREELDLTAKDPRHLFICGPLALKQLMLARNVSPEKVDFLQWYRAGSTGTSLAEVGRLADKASLAHRLILRQPGQVVPVPSIVHWKVGHFAAIIGQANGRFHVRDSVFPGSDLWVTQAALDAEASGYFLVPTDVPADPHWRTADAKEATAIWGRGPTNQTRRGDPNDPNANDPGPSPPALPPLNPPTPQAGPPPSPQNPKCPLCGYNIKESSVAVSLSDTPVGYSPPVGPSAKVEISYNQREDSQPAVFSFFNVSPKWTISWLSYVTDDPTNPGASVSRYMRGGGAFYYLGYDANAGTFAAQDDDGSILVRASGTPITYRHQLRDGSTEIYAQSDGATAYPRRVFLSQVIDPQGNSVSLTYDGQQRLISLTDAVGRLTTFTYGLAGRPLLVTQISDPFGRSAALTYDASGRLSSITDIIGLTSSFGYDANSLVNSLTTPYGTTTFAYTAPGTSSPPRFVEVADPLGYHEREEWLEPSVIPNTDPASTVPQGMAVRNNYLTYRNSFHWDKDAYLTAGCTPTGGCDYTKARIRHFVHMPDSSIKGTAIESVKYPLENRIWYNYPGQANSIYGGTFDRPTAIGRVLDDGTTQLSTFSYDTSGFFNLTQAIDPTGRTTSYAYANQVDLAAVSQTTQAGVQTTIAQYIYNNHHRPLFYTDAAGQMWRYAYNDAGQITSSTDPLGHTTTYHYDSSANLTSITNANNATAATYTYDGFDRVRTYTDSEGWTLTYDYDAADRVTSITYPDGTADRYTYDELDLVSYADRLNRLWSYAYDANRRLTKVTDPLDGQTLLGYDGLDQLASLTDPKSNTTTWTYDIQGRLKQKTYADSSTVTYTYENTTSRLKSLLDALGQTKQFSYAKDDRLSGITYVNAVNPTPNVSFAYDTYFPRLASMTDGTGTTQYSYFPPFAQGALHLQLESGPLANSAITYTYDELGRLASRNISGAGAETFGYDAIGRLTSNVNDLGSFTLSYLGQTGQITNRQLANSTLSTSWSYLSNSGDRRLAQISTVGLSVSQFSTYQYSTTPENLITAITETSDSSAAYPPAGSQTASYNNLNQLTNLSGQALSYDANGNLLSDGQRTYSWNAENRLINVTYPGQPGKATAFIYDGLGRRTVITSTPAGGSATTTYYLWCGVSPCQSRNASNSPTRAYFVEGELVPGAPAQPYYYGTDQIGSVRRVFVSPGSAPANDYDPYGVPLQATAPVTDFGYAGMLANPDSGLDLTLFRAYEPIAGRWLSRDLVGEAVAASPLPVVGPWSNLANFRALGQFNLYTYVTSNPISWVDPLGLARTCGEKIRSFCAGLMALCSQYIVGDPGGNTADPAPEPPIIEIDPTSAGQGSRKRRQ
ncbi:RHS repeat-associated core domain-containing protein [Mesorhizobium sp.]|uniref:RHS repeat-associated core domain-containing protein n=1 Tax=Mesorhizobium sp. TaxID=1871066 RepID=UPI000FE7AF7E|nr:RHS repeat-associated core domain-containing protein [Mesorhizobium sp.]RWA64665.1 MAG: peptidase C39 [Mesorhizobium sp.]RWA82953.1 MAG: peptidase C39 [Mesorhizobium sp.]